MSKVTQSKPTRHGERLIGKMVIVTAKNPPHGLCDTRCGKYSDVYGSAFSVETDLGPLFGRCKDWVVEEIIEADKETE